MIFNKHSNYEGLHAFLGASKFHWINYDKNKLIAAYTNHLNVERGTILHDFAARCIRLEQKLPKSNKTLNLYVNDAVGFKMTPELLLFYSPNCFGTADAISFRDNFLRIHDFKSGVTPTHIEQLEVYAALFCLEYKYKPTDIDIELRIYQSNEVLVHQPEPQTIIDIMDKIVEFDKLINKINEQEK